MRVSNDSRVDKQIRSLSKEDSARIVRLIELLEQYGLKLTEPYLKKLNRDIWELRSARWRLLFGVIKQQAIIVHIFFKQTQKTPKQEIELASKRLKMYE